MELIDVVLAVTEAVIWSMGFAARAEMSHFSPILLMALRFTCPLYVCCGFSGRRVDCLEIHSGSRWSALLSSKAWHLTAYAESMLRLRPCSGNVVK